MLHNHMLLQFCRNVSKFPKYNVRMIDELVGAQYDLRQVSSASLPQL
jgi:hypothetical protein